MTNPNISAGNGSAGQQGTRDAQQNKQPLNRQSFDNWQAAQQYQTAYNQQVKKQSK